jgi:predicted TIM-barrel fold metal-dependent hydrolase
MSDDLHFFNACPVMLGRGISHYADFPQAADLVAHLDYLGIERSLVAHREAADVNPGYGNRKLLDAIAPYRERLYPALVVTPHLWYERDSLQSLKAMLADGCRALVARPTSGGYRPGMLERLLQEVRGFKPFVHITLDEADSLEVAALAPQFPDITFAVGGFYWPALSHVLDMLWRCPNVVVENSGNHVTGALELTATGFGPDRSLFGFRRRSDYGATVAALARADLAPAVRQRLAGGTLQDLLDAGPFRGTVTPPALLEQKPLWRRFRQGGLLEDIEIIDAHGHSGPADSWNYIDTSVEPERYVRRLLDLLDRNSVNRLIVSHMTALKGNPLTGNREIEDACARFDHQKRISGYYVFNPLYGDELVPEIGPALDRGFFKGLKLLCSYWKVPLTDPRFTPVWEWAEKRHLPILIHTWEGPHNSPAMLQDIVTRYPHAIFLLGHSGGGDPGRAEAVALALANANVRLEFCGSFMANTDFADTIRAVGIDRIVYGSDMDGHNPAWELGRFLSQPLPDADLQPALAANIRGILDGILPAV